MATNTQPPVAKRAPATGPAGAQVRALPPSMTRCECAGVTFEEVARRMHAERLAAEQVLRGTSCGQNCGACIPDLLGFLASR